MTDIANPLRAPTWHRTGAWARAWHSVRGRWQAWSASQPVRQRWRQQQRMARALRAQLPASLLRDLGLHEDAESSA